MKRILIISPHFPPSNLAAVHRSRLFAQHLPEFGWEPVVLTVDEKYYEESLDWNLVGLLPSGLRIEKVAAFPLTKPRLIGDIGLRGFFYLYKKARALIRRERFDFLYILIPSFYSSLLGRWLHASTDIPYGIDYIDPWVHRFPGSERRFSRHWWSTQVARRLEPIAVKKAALITGVAEGYYSGVKERNPHLAGQSIFGAMPYGGEAADHQAVRELALRPYLFPRREGKMQMVYAGAMLPKAYAPLEAIFQSMQEQTDLYKDVEFHFIGTGKTPNDPLGYNIKPLAEKYGIWQSQIFEYPRRIPYMDVLVHLDAVDGIFVLGSTEPHYTPSKVYQAVLSGKPVMAVLHTHSTAVDIIRRSKGGIVLDFEGEQQVDRIRKDFNTFFGEYKKFRRDFDPLSVDRSEFNAYSARNVTSVLASYLEQGIKKTVR